MLIIKVVEDAALAAAVCEECGLAAPAEGQFTARAEENGKTVGCSLFRLGQWVVTVDQVKPLIEDELVMDGLVRTCLNYAVGRNINCAEFAPEVDRDLLTRIYGDTAEKDMENLAYFFQNCKKCANCR